MVDIKPASGVTPRRGVATVPASASKASDTDGGTTWTALLSNSDKMLPKARVP